MLSFLLTVTPYPDRNRIEELYSLYSSDMLKIAGYMFYNAGKSDYSSLAEDAVQNCFLRIIKHISKIDLVGKDKEKAYIFVMLKNECLRLLNDLNGRNDDVELTDEVSDEDFFEKLSIKLNYDRVVAEIKNLDDIYSVPLMLKYVEDMKVSEIAKLMNIPEKTVYTRIARAKKILVEKMKIEGELL